MLWDCDVRDHHLIKTSLIWWLARPGDQRPNGHSQRMPGPYALISWQLEAATAPGSRESQPEWVRVSEAQTCCYCTLWTPEGAVRTLFFVCWFGFCFLFFKKLCVPAPARACLVRSVVLRSNCRKPLPLLEVRPREVAGTRTCRCIWARLPRIRRTGQNLSIYSRPSSAHPHPSVLNADLLF